MRRFLLLALLLATAGAHGADYVAEPGSKLGFTATYMDDELELNDYEANFRRMFGNPRMDAVMGSVDGSVRFFGLTPTSMKLGGLDRHRRLIDSYKKLHMKRTTVAALSG